MKTPIEVEPKECEECHGTGKNMYSCCGSDMTEYLPDYTRCPQCHENFEPTECEVCNGTGVIEQEP